MKRMTRLISLLLVIMMTCSLFVGCGNNSEDAVSAEGDGKITVGIAQNVTIPNYETNGFTTYMEEVTGLEIEWMYFASGQSEYNQQVALMCSAKQQLPDVLLGMSFGHYTVNQYGEDGYFVDLSELIETNAPNYQNALSQLSEDLQQYIKEKGTNTTDGTSFYALPSVTVATPDNMQSMMYINKTWLDAVGMYSPTNIAELKAVCEAFETKDPNGNNRNDEIPMLGDAALYDWILNAFVEYDDSNFNVANGKVWDPVYTSEFRQGVACVNEMVANGWYSTLGFTATSTEMKQMISDGLVGIFCGHHDLMTNATSDILDEYIALGPLADETGKGGYNIINEVQVDFDGIITKDCKDIGEAMLFLDAFYLDEAVTRQRFGVKDVDWKYTEEAGESAYGEPSNIQVLNPQAFFDLTLNCTLGNLLGIMTDKNYKPIEQTAETSSNNHGIQSDRLIGELWEIYKNSGKKQEGVLDSLVYTQEEYEIREQKNGLVWSCLKDQIVQFMHGQKDVANDAQWNEFLSELESQGRGELMKVAQDAYDRKVERQKSNK